MNTSKTGNWFSRAGQSIGSFFRFIAKFFKGKPPVGTTDNPVGSGDNLDDDESYDEYSKKISALDDIIVKLGLYKRISASHKYMYEMGRRDGSLGVVLGNLANIAKATAQEVFRHIYVIVKGRLAGLKSEFDAAKSIKDDDEGLYTREQAYCNYVEYQYRFFPRNYSFFLFILYLFFAIALILADMPLALKLIQNGFDLDVGPGKLVFKNLFTGNFWNIIANNWETSIMAMGIALCTIYIKIYYDEFVGTPYASRLMTFKRFLLENKIEHLDENDKTIKQEHRTKVIWKTVLFGITMLVIIILAIFRLKTAGLASQVPFWAGAAFIAITILFPLIGGICLSYSLNNIQNLWRKWSANRKCIKSRNKWMESVKKLTVTENNYEDIVATDIRLSDEIRLVEEYKIYLIAFYERGYAIGGMQPEKYSHGEDFFSKIMEWRNIAVSKKANHHIGSPN